MNTALKKESVAQVAESDNDRIDEVARACCGMVLAFLATAGDYSSINKMIELLERAIGNDKGNQTEVAVMLRRELLALQRDMGAAPLTALRWLLTK
jgi:hypothetical protein